MTRRKGELTAEMNERDFPFIVEMPLPGNGFGIKLHYMYRFHHERGLLHRGGTRQRRDDQEYVRWCFKDEATVKAFRRKFGGSLLKPPDRH